MKRSYISRLGAAIFAHKVISAIVIVIILSGGFYAYKKSTAGSSAPQYVLSRARTGSIVTTVTGTGQISASNQLDITASVSGSILGINVKVGQKVRAGELLATIDPKQAAINLENARIALSKLTEPPKATDVSNAENTLSKSYTDALNNISAFYLDMPAIMSGLRDLFYSRNGFLSDQLSSDMIPAARNYRLEAATSYDNLVVSYSAILADYKNLNRNSATSTIEDMMNRTYDIAKAAASTLQKANNTITFITSSQPEYRTSDSSVAATEVNTWSTTVNGDLANLSSSRNTVASSKNTLSNLLAGSDSLDIAQQKLSLTEQERNYANYFIRAPFAGIIGRIPVSVYSQAGNGTVIATLIGEDKIATISLNEIDAAKVAVGNPVVITFDALSDLTATGTVSEVDLVGTVTQGVVTYNVKIAVNTNDQRIRPGMSVNASITTNRLDNVLIVPSSAVKTENRRSVVQAFDTLPVNRSTSTPAFNTNFGGRPITITSKDTPRTVIVTTGKSDDTNTEIISGLTEGAWVVSRTITATAQSSSAPSILNTLGGNRTGGGNATFRAVPR